jgi:hypothetical protein
LSLLCRRSNWGGCAALVACDIVAWVLHASPLYAFSVLWVFGRIWAVFGVIGTLANSGMLDPVCYVWVSSRCFASSGRRFSGILDYVGAFSIPGYLVLSVQLESVSTAQAEMAHSWQPPSRGIRPFWDGMYSASFGRFRHFGDLGILEVGDFGRFGPKHGRCAAAPR